MSEPLRILLHYDRPEAFEDLIADRFPDAALHCCTSYSQLAGELEAFRPQVLFCIKFENAPYPRDAVMSCRSLRWVANGGAGVDHLMPWDPERLTVTNASGVASHMMAEYVIAGMLALSMDLPGFMRDKAERRWRCESVAGIAGKTAVIVGLGRTGRAIARLAKRMEMHVVGIRARACATEHVDTVYPAERLHEALACGDFVVISAPLIPSTRGLIDARAMAAMRPGAFLIDVSRGGIVVESALVQALRDRRLAGAVLDVFEREPLPDTSPLWELPQVIVTPHCSSVFEGWERRAAEMFCDNLARWIDGQPLANVVDPQRGY
jgi:phosphoglycerate dehydrogenase-like enzyme